MNTLCKLSFIAGGSELVLPITPETFEVGHGIKIETVNIHAVGDIRVAGYPTLENVNISSFFPASVYSFAIGRWRDPWDYVRQFKKWADNQTVVRFLVSGTDINMPVLIESIMTSEQDGSNDVYYTLSLAEYRYVSMSLSSNRTAVAAVTRAVTTQPETPDTYTVVKGDTLRNIARKYYGDSSKYTVIASANGISNPNLIYPGTVLQLPGA